MVILFLSIVFRCFFSLPLYYLRLRLTTVVVLGETRHLIGREEWLSTVLQTLQALPPKKIIVLQGPIGVGKTSELNRLARHFMSLGHSSYHVIWIPMLSGERVGGPEAALDVFLGILLNENKSPVPGMDCKARL